MNKQFFLLIALTVLPTAASQQTLQKKRPPRTPFVHITIDDRLTDPKKCTIQVSEDFSYPYNKDETYRLELVLDSQNNKWLSQFYKTTYTQDPRPYSKVMGKTNSIPELPLAKKEEFTKLLNRAAFGHIYLHRDDHLAEIWTQFYKDPLKWLCGLITLRKTVWTHKDQKLSLMDHSNLFRERLERELKGARALYQQTKDAADKKEYAKLQFYSVYQSHLDAQAQIRFGQKLSDWKKGVFQEIERQEKLAQQKKELEKYRKELKEWKKKKNEWVKQRLAIRPKHMRDFLSKRTMNKENILLKRKLKTMTLHKTHAKKLALCQSN